jgi:tripartite-type tricarboxylate transporter receptor subunit TctC
MTRRIRASALIGTALLAQAFSLTASSQVYPSKPVRIIIATSAGANPDIIGRALAHGLTQVWGQQVVVENRAGAGGNIGAEIAARAAPDGHTLLLAHTNHSINVGLYRKLNYDILRDFSPITLAATGAFVASVHPSVPARTLRDLVALAKARPGALNYASAGIGSGGFFATEYFDALANIKMQHVAYAGGGPAITSVVAGETSVYFTPLSIALPHFRSGRLRPLAVTSLKRLPELPDIPPIADTVPGYEMLSWAGLMAPAKTPKDIVATVHQAAVTALNRPELRKQLEVHGLQVVPDRPEEMEAYVKREIEKYAKVIRQVGIPLQ